MTTAPQPVMKTNRTQTAKPMPTPNEWQNGRIKLPGPPAKPIRGRGHERIRLLGSECPTNERVARKWYFLGVMCENSEHAAKVTEGNSSPMFLSVEAYQLWCDHKAFWMAEAMAEAMAERQAALVQKKAAAQKINKSLRRAAAKASFTTTELKAKMKRLEALLKDDHGYSLALELIKTAEPWLLEALLAGVSLHKRGCLELDHGAFFDTSGIPFWLSVARSLSMGCCPPSFNSKKLIRLDISAYDAAQMEIITVDILPHLTAVQELHLSVSAFTFSTAALPVMPEISRIILVNNDWSSISDIKIDGLNKQKNLKALMIMGPFCLQIAEDQEKFFDRVRLETSDRSYGVNSDGLLCIARPPNIGGCVAGMNLSAARVLVQMCADHSSSCAPPQWWDIKWTDPGWRKTIRNGRADSHREDLLNRELDLGWLASIDSEIADVLSRIEVPICIPALLLNSEILERFKYFKSRMHIEDVAGDDSHLARDLVKTSIPSLRIDLTGNLSPDTARELACFRGPRLNLNLLEGKLDEAVAEALSAYAGNLTLTPPTSGHCGLPEFDKESAEKLVLMKGGLHIDGNWKLKSEVLGILGQRSDFNLGIYRVRYLERQNRKNVSFYKIQLLFDTTTDGFKLSVTKGKKGDVGQLNEVCVQLWNHENFVNRLIKEGYQEISFNTGIVTT